jgi:hypothetical protein
MSSGIPLDSNFKNLSCQLGGLRLNGNVLQQTATTYSILKIDDPMVIRGPTGLTGPVGYLQVNIGNTGSIGPTGFSGNYGLPFYIPIYQ